jgi:hypothetical protein
VDGLTQAAARQGVSVEVVTGKEAEELVTMAASDHLPPREHPLREEAVTLEASDGERSIMTLRKIVRPAGHPAYIEPLKIDQGAHGAGRFANMLANVPAMQ